MKKNSKLQQLSATTEIKHDAMHKTIIEGASHVCTLHKHMHARTHTHTHTHQGSHCIHEAKFKDFSRTFKGHKHTSSRT